jgi:hypothetical protein
VSAIAVALWLAGCATVPPTRFHTLMPPPEARATAPATTPAPWQLLPVTVPAQVDRPQFVLRSGDGSLAVLDQERWIAPLADELAGALADALGRRLGPPLGRDPWQVAVDVQRFESVPGRAARLDAAWSVRRADAAALRCLASIEQPAGDGVAALAAAHRRAVQALGERIAEAIVALQAGRPAGCGSQP